MERDDTSKNIAKNQVPMKAPVEKPVPNPENVNDKATDLPEGVKQVSLMDANHKLAAQHYVDEAAGKFISIPEYVDYGYIQMGDGDEVIVTTDIKDAMTFQKLRISSKVVAPLIPKDLVAVCSNFVKGFPSDKYVILGNRDLAPSVSAAKMIMEARSDYPPRQYDSWTDFYMEEGGEAVVSHLLRQDVEAASIEKFAVTDDVVSAIEEERFIFENLIINQHIVVICAEPNAGKTTIMNWVCSQVSETTDVRYINQDCSGSDLKAYQQFAQSNGFQLLNFDITNTEDRHFLETLESCDDLTNKLYVIDTLKKFVDLMGKSSVKAFMKRLRKLCNKGATFVLLAHTNKHKTNEGLPVYEGVGDVKSDCDELIYLLPQDNNDGSKTVTTLLDKTRGPLEPITFTIAPDRSVSQSGYVDLVMENRRKADDSIVQTISRVLEAGSKVQKDIVVDCQSQGIGKRQTMRVLNYYSEGAMQLWSKTKGENNSWVYELISGKAA